MNQHPKVRLMFQPAEEGPGGAEPMIAAGCLEGICMHLLTQQATRL